MKLQVLIAEDNALVRLTMSEAMKAAGHDVSAVADGEQAMALVTERAFDVIISDIWMPRAQGMSLFQHARKHSPNSAVMLVTAHGNVDDAVECLKAGVDDYITKPFDPEDLVKRAERLGECAHLNQQLRAAHGSGNGQSPTANLIGRSQVMLGLAERIRTVAPTNASVMILGESGTGKELVARAIHEASPRAAQPFITVNCAALPETLIEAELFGHERGAFTGANQKREGRFKAADGGTLLLDEVGEIPLSIQAKLLRALQENTIEPLGSNRPLPLDVRLICATHRNLKQLISEGAFREDLYYRLNVLDIQVPPLRERQADLPLLVSHFYQRFAGSGAEARLHSRAWAALMRHPFPGNVRELEHAIHHAVVLSQGMEIDVSHLPADIREQGATKRTLKIRPLCESLKDFERECLIGALNETKGVKFKAAHLLGISRKTLWEKLKAHRITDFDRLADKDDPGGPSISLSQ